MISITTLSDFLKTYEPRKITGRRFFIRSSVAIVLAGNHFVDKISMLMIRRATRKGDPWSGDMGFPGGRFSTKKDENIYETAIRELYEETGVEIKDGLENIGRLSELLTKAHERMAPMVITPFVFKINKTPDLKKSNEVEELIWIPLSYFFNQQNRVTMEVRKVKFKWSFPCYIYNKKCIWGLSLNYANGIYASKDSHK
ncbi:MAG: CoA pyrophosphatase [Desulfobacteraceae bacterium]|nr:CoA pyrophosphatase [Desulfobacteraceae bacterium]MBC2755926.1 CoA pyrophosphatase [Desulfobacteraceae bacterium]